ncbi:uncharacterized protein LOC125883859 [Epinephelus fuscoguttatus]|uniref:uncharacterized protein LOC125883859 n=1 Tax=Epinephelus fuscoguttatus TaxID=293821 RepID=UPI0020D1D617|nr:uncharacterized protein LOC125883859 [Epinephelus fuscoguttatus]
MTTALLRKLKVKVMDWPSMYPALNSPVHLCLHIHLLHDVIMEEWERIPEATCELCCLDGYSFMERKCCKDMFTVTDHTTVMEMKARPTPHSFIFVDEAGFNLAKTCCRGRQLWMSQAREEKTLQCVLPSPVMVCFCTNLSLVRTVQRGSFLSWMTSIISFCQQGREVKWQETQHLLLCGIMWHSTTLLQSLTGLLHIPGCLSFSCLHTHPS